MIRGARLWTALCWLAGWCSLTAFATLATDWRAALLSAGLLLLGMGGIRPLVAVLKAGLATSGPSTWFAEREAAEDASIDRQKPEA